MGVGLVLIGELGDTGAVEVRRVMKDELPTHLKVPLQR
jgi:hypothetical protein